MTPATSPSASRGQITADEDILAAGIEGCAVRFTAIPIAVDKVALNAGIVPFSKAILEAKVADMGFTLSSPHCPTVAMKLLTIGGRSWNAKPVDFLPTEKDTDCVGVGHLPLLESIGDGNPVFPDVNKVEEEVSTFLGGVYPTNNVSVARILDLYESPATFSSSMTGSVSHRWPEYRGPVVAELRNDTQG